MSEDGTEDNNGNMNINASALPPLTTAEASSLIPSNNLSNLSRHNDYQVPTMTPTLTPLASPSEKSTYWPSFFPTLMPWPSLSPINAPTQIPSLFFTPSPPPPVFYTKEL